MNRRRFLAATGAVLGSIVAGVAANREYDGPGDRGEVNPANDMVVSVNTILEGTEQETEVYTIRADDPGPTAVVVGGIHGDEENGYLAAERIVSWRVNRGSLVVIPRANVVAIDEHTRGGGEGDLNRHFPPGKEPTMELARAIWSVVAAADPAVVIDLHSSRGIFRTHPRWAGQAIFPTDVGNAVADAAAVVEHMNDHVVPGTMQFHRFDWGNVHTGTKPRFIHKVAGDLEKPGFVVELTEFLLDLNTQVRWTLTVTEQLLDRNGIRRIADAP